ncbi:helix-turn-helix domain-containing protein [Mesorhizobium neociceri]|uniref:helix-turn-helix domain-containing protein n=1 Tax=Mesorhizobium neociceri TaxID=1307853 RepID=UPI001F3AA9B3|nr:helix-turn-helix domain-containing protein [Mesorhizobium neociceri]
MTAGSMSKTLAGLKEHDRLVMAESQMERRLRERRVSSKLSDLIELELSRPLVSTGMVQKGLIVTKQGALNLVGELWAARDDGQGKVSGVGIV